MGLFSFDATKEKPIKPIWFAIILVPLFVLVIVLQFAELKEVTVGIVVDETPVEVVVVDTPSKLAKGLSGVEYLPNGEGMLFLFPGEDQYGIWMRGMVIPIDIVWLRDGKIVDIAPEVTPPPSPDTPSSELRTYIPREAADMVLEVSAGFAGASGWKIGDSVKILTK